jgi:hypothetical protein
MKYNLSNIIGDAGEHLFASRIIKLFGFPCRLINIDIGLDAEIEIIDDNYKSTGEFLKCQVKTTKSDKFYLYVEEKHIEYWNKINIPVIIFLVHIDTEKIYWHCVDSIDKYKKGKSEYVITFEKTDILKKSNKERFKDLAYYHIINEIKKIYEESYSIALDDTTQYLDTDNYDITTFEEFVYHANKIQYDLKKVKRLMLKNKSLEKVAKEYSDQLDFIDEYLERIEEEKEGILIEFGSDYYDHLNNENWDWV